MRTLSDLVRAHPSACETGDLFEVFTESAREAIQRAQAEAEAMGHDAVHVEHLLLGLFSDNDGIVGHVFATLRLSSHPVRALVEQQLALDARPASQDGQHFSPETKAALRSANMIGMGKPGPEHILIIILRDSVGVCKVLRTLGADPHQIRSEIKSEPGRRAQLMRLAKRHG